MRPPALKAGTKFYFSVKAVEDALLKRAEKLFIVGTEAYVSDLLGCAAPFRALRG